MDGMLSQDEINALLSGMDLSEEKNSEAVQSDTASGGSAAGHSNEEVILTEVERDAIGEVANISMGSSATTLYSLVNRKVSITSPIVSEATWDVLLAEYERPCVFIQIKYTQGLDGSNILVLKENDVKIITDLMMGGDGTNTGGELSELHLSAISEAMNQMMGSAATSLSTMLGMLIDISPPESTLLNLVDFKSGEEVAPFLGGIFVKISFRMQIGDLVDSTIMQLYPVDFSRKMIETFMNKQMMDWGGQETLSRTEEAPPAAQTIPEPAAVDMNSQMNMDQMGMMNSQMNTGQMGMMNPQTNMGQMGMMNPQMNMNQMGMMNPQMNMNQMGMMNPQMNMGQMGMVNTQMNMNQMATPNVNIQPAQFQSFTSDFNPAAAQENIGLIMDVPLEVTVELGRTVKSISDILDFAPGTIIELDRIAGEPIDVLVNGKFVARGEVVVIEESFGVRVTEIIK